MNSHLKTAPRTFPDRIAELGFTADLPVDWISHDLPKEDVDFSNPTLLVPLAVVTAPHAAIVFAFAARPAYDDGALNDWALYLLNHNQLQPRALGRDVIAGVSAVVGEAAQTSDLGPMVVRFAFLEDGNRLLNLTLTAPELFADSVRDAWFAMLKSFKLETPRGSRFKPEAHPDNIPAAPIPIPEPGLEPKPTAPPDLDSVVDSETGEPLLSDRIRNLPLPAASPTPRTRLYDFALSNDSIALDEDHETNVNLRNRGVGLVPNIAGLSDEARCATLAAGAILAQFDVPYGWHVIDDGKRTLVFEPGGKIQISLNLIPREDRSIPAILDELEAQTRKDYPHPEFARVEEGRICVLAVRHIADGDQPLEQYHLLHPFRDESMVLRARVTATPEQASNATNLAELILASCVFECIPPDDEPEPTPESEPADQPVEDQTPALESSRTPPQLPAWWQLAIGLEAKNQLEEAEQVIRQACQHLGFAAATAEMYRLRMLRLKASGDREGALEAFKRSSDYIWRYASMATSGGEGEALSRERDEFRAELVAQYGSDPEARP